MPYPLSTFIQSLLTELEELKIDYVKIHQFEQVNELFYINCFEQIFANLSLNLHKIDPHYKLIVWFTNSKDNSRILEKLIDQAANKWQLKQKIKFRTGQINFDKSLLINQLIDNIQPELYLFISNNAEDQTSSAFISASLIINTQLLSTLYNIKPQSYLLRSMQTTQQQS